MLLEVRWLFEFENIEIQQSINGIIGQEDVRDNDYVIELEMREDSWKVASSLIRV
jgi:hypothetical protein